jgi:predicted cytidylate kinase
MIIAISGLPGSGKTSVGRMLAKELGYRFYSMGDLRGRMATERNLTIDQLNDLAKKEAWTDRDVDEYQRRMGLEEDNFVMEGWLSGHFIPHAFKVFLTVEPATGADRIFRDQRPDEPKQVSPSAVRRMLDRRVRDSDARYRRLYGFDYRDRRHYDLVIDTTDLTKQQVAKRILEGIKSRDNNPSSKSEV